MKDALQQPVLVRLFGAALFIGTMAAGYLYNITFVQLGLTDLGERALGLPPQAVASAMAAFALITCVVALLTGAAMSRWGLSSSFRAKTRVAFFALLLQTLLTLLSLRVGTAQAFYLWILLAGAAMGVAVPATFGLAVDWVPVSWRGAAAGAITGISYLAANLLPVEWRIEPLAQIMVMIMPAGLILFGAIGFLEHPWISQWEGQSNLPEFADGQYVEAARANGSVPWRLLLVFGLMFAVFFIDSLGFLRLLDSPRYMLSAWQSPEIAVRLALGMTHVLGAAIGAIFYSRLGNRHLFLAIFGSFALTHLLYTMNSPLPQSTEPALAAPLLYALSVSLYTVLNFALWADISTPRTITRNSALGVAVSGWTATFLSTALALRWRASGVPLLQHLQSVNALAMVLFLAMLIYIWLAPNRLPAAERPHEK